MNRNALLKLFAAAALCLWGAVYTVRHAAVTADGFADAGQTIIRPEKIQNDAIAALVINQKGRTLTFTKDKADRWAFLEAEGYPADREKVDGFIAALHALKKDGRGTALPEFYDDEGLGENDACFLSLLDADGNVLAALFAGNSAENGRYFVRAGDERQTYVTASPVPLCQTDKEGWINKTVYSFAPETVESVTFSLPAPDGRFIRFSRKTPQDSYTTETSDAFYTFFVPDDVARQLASFSFTDFQPAPTPRAPAQKITVTFFDGLRVTLNVDSDNAVVLEFDAADDAAQQADATARTLSDGHTPWRYAVPEDFAAVFNLFLERE